jgi:hypothetical protein
LTPISLYLSIHLIGPASQIWSTPLRPICRSPKVAQTEKRVWDLKWNQFLVPQSWIWTVVQAHFYIWAPKWGSSPPRGPFKEKFQIFLSSSSLSIYKGPTIWILAILANYYGLQCICCHFWSNLSPGAALGYLRNGALDQKTFLAKVGWYEV